MRTWCCRPRRAVDDPLRAIVHARRGARPGARFDSAAAMRDALAAVAWRRADEPLPQPAAAHGTLDFLLRRMRHKSDFPALSDSVVRIQRVANFGQRKPEQPGRPRS